MRKNVGQKNWSFDVFLSVWFYSSIHICFVIVFVQDNSQVCYEPKWCHVKDLLYLSVQGNFLSFCFCFPPFRDPLPLPLPRDLAGSKALPASSESLPAGSLSPFHLFLRPFQLPELFLIAFGPKFGALPTPSSLLTPCCFWDPLSCLWGRSPILQG